MPINASPPSHHARSHANHRPARPSAIAVIPIPSAKVTPPPASSLSSSQRPMTRLCGPIVVSSLEQARRDAILAAEHGADLVEFRIDTFTDAAPLQQLLASCPVPAIVTCRAAWEGGHC